MLYPDQTFRQGIDAVSFLLLLLISLYIPLVLAFNIDTTGTMSYLELCFDIWFLLEIALNFNTGYYEKGILVMNRKSICLKYVKTWFFLDLFSSIPISLIDIFAEFEEDNYSAL